MQTMLDGFGPSASLLFGFAFYYPLFMAYHWMIGALYYFLHYEVRVGTVNEAPRLPSSPAVSFLVPCHDDQGIIEETINLRAGTRGCG
jgi:biofilm PGA synthesis N-glycosyltransferase PgaC